MLYSLSKALNWQKAKRMFKYNMVLSAKYYETEEHQGI